MKILIFCSIIASVVAADQPNIIFILADDLGYNDVGFRNSDVITPNIDALAKEGMILSQSYVQPLCTPTRAAFLTGMYPIHIGRQGFVLSPNIPSGLTLDKKLLPEYLKELGYSTHLVGKWHLGYCKKEYLPMNRGFDSFYGFWNGAESYYSKMRGDGFDFHDGDQTLIDDETAKTVYSTHLYRDRILDILNDHSLSNSSKPFFLYTAFQAAHTPHKAPQEYEDLYPHVHLPHYKPYYAMITAMDEAIGAMTQKLKELGLYENTIIAFLGDNGAPIQMVNSNLPFKGFKGTSYEGGTRSVAFVHSPLIPQQTVNGELIHITDWLPTFLKLAGSENIPEGLDGVDQTGMLTGKNGSSRQEMVYNIQEINENIGTSGAIRFENWKLIVNQSFFNKYLLFDLENDPEEKTNLIDEYPEVFIQMLEKYEAYAQTMVAEDSPDGVSSGNIINGDYVTGWC